MNSTSFQKRSPNPIRRSRFACQSIGLVDRPFPSVGWSVDCRQQKVHVCQSTDRFGRPLSLLRSITPVHVVQAGRPGSRPATVLACIWTAFSLLLDSDLCTISANELKNSSIKPLSPLPICFA